MFHSLARAARLHSLSELGGITNMTFRKGVARFRRRRAALLPLCMILGGGFLFFYNMRGIAWWFLTPYHMSMRAQVEWARYMDKVAPSFETRIDVLRKPVPGVGGNESDLLQGHRPIAMIGVFMMDTPQAVFARKILRLIYPKADVLLRFVICRPTAATMAEADVLAIDMEENMNEGKTQRWFDYAGRNLPPSVEAVFKMDDDVIFCWSHLRNAIKRSRKSRYSYYGRFIDHAECGQYFHCPPEHCNGRAKFEGDCYYYMQGGLYGFSSALLAEVRQAPMFRTDQEVTWHEDIMAGQWVNQTVSRTSVTEVPFWPYHDKSLVRVDPPEYENIIKAYGDGLWQIKCVGEYVNVMAELDILHQGANLYQGTRGL